MLRVEANAGETKDCEGVRGNPQRVAITVCLKAGGTLVKRPMLWAALVGMLASVVLTSGCSSGTGELPAVRQDISAAQLQAMMNDGQTLVIVDVRTPEEFAAGHIPGSVNIPVTELDQRTGELDHETRTVVVCWSGARSSLAAQILLDRGFADIYNLVGGLQAWPGDLETGG